jgi:hypothetical protein
MQSFSPTHPVWTKVMRWTARSVSLMLILLTLFFFTAEEIFRDHPRTTPLPIVGVVLGALLITGLGLSWKWERPGALISLVAFIGISVVNPDALTKPLWYMFPVTAVLFLLCWWSNRFRRPTETNVSQRG